MFILAVIYQVIDNGIHGDVSMVTLSRAGLRDQAIISLGFCDS